MAGEGADAGGAGAGTGTAAGAAGGNAAGAASSPTGATTAPADDDAALGAAGEKALEAWKQRARAAEAWKKEHEPLVGKAREADEAAKTAEQRAAERAVAAERDRDAATLLAAQYEAAAEAGLPLKMATRLRGTTPEELVEDAKALLAELGGGNGQAGAQQRRVPAGNAGDQGGAPGGSMSDTLRDMFRRGRGSITT